MSERSPDSHDASNALMDLRTVSRYLRVPEEVVVRLVQTGDLPGDRVSSHWRFQKTVIDSWLTARIQSAETKDLAEVLKMNEPLIPIPTLISPDRVVLNLQPGTKRKVLTQLVRPLLMTSVVSDAANFLVSLLDREAMVSTALCDGIAIPHVRDQETSGIKETCVVLGICPEGTDFDALDGEKTYLFFLVCARTTSEHLRLLAKLTLLVRQPQIVQKFCDCTTKEQVIDLIVNSHISLSMLI